MEQEKVYDALLCEKYLNYIMKASDNQVFQKLFSFSLVFTHKKSLFLKNLIVTRNIE
jgi:hypothetical protein